MLGLHSEDTYSLPEDASPEEIIDAEMARRTFWVLYSTSLLPSSFLFFAYAKQSPEC